MRVRACPAAGRGGTTSGLNCFPSKTDPLFGTEMTHVVTESCIRCRYTDCVDVCPVDCFREGPNFLAIDPDE